MKGSFAILTHGDVLQIPGCQSFTYVHLVKEDQLAAKESVELKRWRISSRVLGTGSYALVLLASDSKTGYQVACKRQPKSLLVNEEDRKNLRREYKLLKRLTHPNINKLIDWTQDEQHVYFLMNLVCAGDLFNYVCGNHGRLTDSEAKFIFYQLAKAVQYLHAKGIAHRDIKPENVLLLNYGRFPRIQLGDFGLATGFQLVGNQPPRSSSLCGTLVYLSSEALRVKVTGEEYDPRGLDLWAMGATLHLTLSGSHPFDHGDHINLEHLQFQIQQHLLESGVIDRRWIRQHGLEEDEELIMLDGSVADMEYAAKAKQDLVNRIMGAVYTEIDDYVNQDAKKLVAALLHPEPARRLRASQIMSSAWIQSSATELGNMYEARVLSKFEQERRAME
ncbi:kinase-like protein [Tilletiaria anomala UBC 951]|uniref:Kinase-like protein n=1 Tax=Tilletiaria anomala (strain ATCC 24038 / CBS 436.72 / UBC 951) TaxID=1037660 RepID=A0A066W0T1_TILAU|nr:kinase-like protein [Tilletiaria anomala UBC 951]KDN44365.1 kinase-like protein [Tilletiaria anomala UBC 951]